MHPPLASQASIEASEWLDYEAAESSSIWKYCMGTFLHLVHMLSRVGLITHHEAASQRIYGTASAFHYVREILRFVRSIRMCL